MRTRDEAGFSMIMVLGVLTVVSALSIVAFQNATGDILPRKQGRERKVAYAAAEAGVNFYLSRLNQDSDYWTKCATGPAPNTSEQNPVNQPWNGSGTDPRTSRVVPGDSSRYSVELLPLPPATTCSTTDPTASMIEPGTGRMRIRATGFVGARKRSIVATLRRKSFLDYLYFTDYETLDPAAYGANASVAEQYCHAYRAQRATGCTTIQFTSPDKVNGPFHTNDDIVTCGGAQIGRTSADRVEVSGAAPGYKQGSGAGCGTGAPNFQGTFQAGVAQLAMPSSNAKITQEAKPEYTFLGTTWLRFNGANLEYAATEAGPYLSKAMPPNGVIWVKSGAGCGAGESPPSQTYAEPAGCANAYVKGGYGKGVTLVSDKDIIVTGSICRDGSLNADGTCSSGGADVLAGLIATNYVRIRHQVTNRRTVAYGSGQIPKCDNVAAGTLPTVTVQSAVLSLDHSFIVDNYDCGTQLGTLTVTGAIAQRFRGPVGTSQADGAITGYTKNYNYDDRFRFRNPPFFLDPVSAGWRVLRVNEQVPAR